MLADIYKSVVEGDVEGVQKGVQKALDSGLNPGEIISEALIGPMDEVGSKMKSGEMFIPEVLIAAEAMKQGLLIIKPLLGEESHAIGKVVIGTVAGDLHDIGKNLVAMLLESSGFDVIDLGIDIPTEGFVTAVEEHKPQIVALSALLTTTMMSMREAVQAIAEKDASVKTMIGGAPVSMEFATEIGASGYAPDGATAVDLAKKLLN